MSDNNEISSIASKVTRKYKFLIPLVIFLNHIAFIYGQVQIMWYLAFYLHIDAKIKATGWESSILFEALGLHNPYYLNSTTYQKLNEFTYGNAISQLWIADGLKNIFLPRFGAIILVLFSGIWPHLKLILLNYSFLTSLKRKIRNKILYYLSTLGKYSIADVFVVCILIAVCNLQLAVKPENILKNFDKRIPGIVKAVEKAINEKEAADDVCNEILQLDCKILDEDFFIGDTKSPVSCSVCIETVEHYYEHPKQLSGFLENLITGIKVTGKGETNLRIAGVAGIHVFCFAVVLSLLLSLFIDILNEKVSKSNEEIHDLNEPLLGEENLNQGEKIEENTEVSENFFKDSTTTSLFFSRLEKGKISLSKYVFLVFLSCFLFGLGMFSVWIPTMERNVPGSIPSVINETLFYDFKEKVSLATLTELIGVKGGWDYFLRLFFLVFCVVGPLFRLISIIVLLCVPMTEKWHKHVCALVHHLGAFCALDVFFLAMILVQVEIGQLSNTIIDQDSKFCKTLLYAGYSESCLTINFNITLAFFTVLFQYGAMLLLSNYIHGLLKNRVLHI
eukprot:maker-scaffold_3-snap-gene-21.4-mRNA-1 protein AED:0.03 eAED:0.03 QI:49/1/1/1/1/1/5/54/561